ncbi:sn-glycerol-3-phosphate transport system permease protein UgpA [Mycobacterium attenuatum]|uniref:sn-glycerol-3-phosphate transport system permease protein UgpA n=1 Tax=Mycobacterium attenuatum TaxID=2341086 RepID=A0A498PUG8_9MYCO|nr:sn-glycerol-3-phosphate transport system permease protein UgpA [Mycobacterium attenuatum]
MADHERPVGADRNDLTRRNAAMGAVRVAGPTVAAISTPTGRYTAPVTPLLLDARRARHRPWRDYALFAVLVGPNVGLLLLFIYRPLADNIRLSLFDWNISDPEAEYVGFSNYAEWFARDDTRQIVANTAVFTTAAVVGSMVLGLVLAMLLDQPLRGRNLVRSTVFAPFVISGAAVGLAAQFIFDPHFGLVQDLLARIGVDVPNFYQDAHWAMFMVTVTYVWKNLGYTFVIYLAALQGVRRDLLEAAEIDGASRWTTFRRVLLPQLRPTTFFLSITVLINSLQVFDVINVMTRGGPQGTGTTTMVYQVYLETFRNFRAGYGATVATIMFLVLLAITYYQVRVMDRGQRQ